MEWAGLLLPLQTQVGPSSPAALSGDLPVWAEGKAPQWPPDGASISPSPPLLPPTHKAGAMLASRLPDRRLWHPACSGPEPGVCLQGAWPRGLQRLPAHPALAASELGWAGHFKAWVGIFLPDWAQSRRKFASSDEGPCIAINGLFRWSDQSPLLVKGYGHDCLP